MTELELFEKVREYANNFTEEFVNNCSEKTWLDDAVKWFKQYEPTEEETVTFKEKLQKWFDHAYTKYNGVEDDYYQLVNYINQLNEMHENIKKIVNRCTMSHSNKTLMAVMENLTHASFGLGLVRSSVNRNKQFEPDLLK